MYLQCRTRSNLSFRVFYSLRFVSDMKTFAFTSRFYIWDNQDVLFTKHEIPTKETRKLWVQKYLLMYVTKKDQQHRTYHAWSLHSTYQPGYVHLTISRTSYISRKQLIAFGCHSLLRSNNRPENCMFLRLHHQPRLRVLPTPTLTYRVLKSQWTFFYKGLPRT